MTQQAREDSSCRGRTNAAVSASKLEPNFQRQTRAEPRVAALYFGYSAVPERLKVTAVALVSLPGRSTSTPASRNVRKIGCQLLCHPVLSHFVLGLRTVCLASGEPF